MEALHIQGAPAVYRCEPSILNQLPDLLSEASFDKAGIIHGEKSMEAAAPYMPELNLETTYAIYGGDCTEGEVNRLSESLVQNDVIIGIGGGKVLDLGKACANQLDVPVILIPTLPSNCAAWTPLSVFYDEEGKFTGYTVYPKSTLFVLVEPELLLQSPEKYLRAGIGDTLAKWYEADVLIRDLPYKPVGVQIAQNAAQLCKDTLLKKGTEAIEDKRLGEVTESFLEVIETIILAGGMVGGFGDHYGRIAAAHSIHNGLTKIPETHTIEHGDKVAYGILVQLMLENRQDEIAALLPFYHQLGLPVSMKSMGIECTSEYVSIVADRTVMQGESIHFMGVSDSLVVAEAILNVEEYTKSKVLD
ncbi:iron-containing alcohol dehydrogenase family protein [Halobacillus litoralis]|uniref:iron-containing alcohol dehydrogenase family protein n=1 Tax=Halobacillus litoralis TaxID=45668 RepID=UPI001CD75FF1|nr:iron-containing alcohol dehydrogenase family protein [Halobacillus litoralis]MCA0971392.1 iron-containing alcohol dehydrogenase family protein [Halobacillus litoralis]